MKQNINPWLLAVALLFSSGASRAQVLVAADASPVQLEFSDRYGDQQTVSLTDGMTLYWPQGFKGADITQSPGVSAVVCDKNGKPVFSYPMSDLGIIKFRGTAADGSAVGDKPASSEPGQDERLAATFLVGGNRYYITQPGELRFSTSAGTYELITATGEHYTIPMAATEMVHYRDTVQGMGGYLAKLQEEHKIYYFAFNNGRLPYADNKLYEDFYAKIPDATNQNISLFVPTDEAFSHVPYIISQTSGRPTVLQLTSTDKSAFPVSTGGIMYGYDFLTGEMQLNPYNMQTMYDTQVANYLVMMLRSHTVLHERPEDRAAGLNSGNDYYLALDGSPLHVIREDGKVTGVQSAFHLWNQQKGLSAMSGGSSASLTRANITGQRSKGNGTLYTIDNTLEATPSCVYSILSGSELAEGEENPFSAFFDICDKSGAFIKNGGLYNQDLNYVGNVPFTLYVPTNEAIASYIADGRLATKADSVRFVKAHIQFGIELADQLPYSREHNTVLVKDGSLATPRLLAQGLGKGKMSVTDEVGNTRSILDAHKNIFVREISCVRDNGSGDGSIASPYGVSTMNRIVVKTCVPGVIHQIDGVLLFNE